MKKIWLLAVMAIVLVGCGSDKTYTTVNEIENNNTIEEPYPVPDGLAIIIDDTTDSVVMVDNGVITIDCGGSCGDITIGAEVPN